MYSVCRCVCQTRFLSLHSETQKTLCTEEMAMTTMAIACGWSSPGVDEVEREAEAEPGLPGADTALRPAARSTGS